MLGAFFFGGIVDRNKKRTAMLLSTAGSLIAYTLGALLFFTTAPEAFADPSSGRLWAFIIILMCGSVAGNLRTIALATTVTLLFAEGRDKANGLIGATNGISFSVTSVLSGLAIGFSGMHLALMCAVVGTVLVLIHLVLIRFDEPEPSSPTTAGSDTEEKHFNVRAIIAVIISVPGLFGLIFFTTFNNFLGGVFMSLMDAYGLTLTSVQTWGILLAFLSFGFIAGSTYIAKYGLGKRPLRLMLGVNVVTWTTCIFFAIQPSLVLLAMGMLVWMTLMPFVEAAEHTIIQSVVPYEKQGRVFGFAQSVESAASPITAFLIGPIAQFIFIPFMTTGAGVALIGDWFGVGLGRGIALVFIFAGIIGLCVTLLAFRSRSYKLLAERYVQTPVTPEAVV